MQKLEGHTPLFVRVPESLFDAAHAEARRRQVVLRVVITDALRARFEPLAPPEVAAPVRAQPPARPVVDGVKADAGAKPLSHMDQLRSLREARHQ